MEKENLEQSIYERYKPYILLAIIAIIAYPIIFFISELSLALIVDSSELPTAPIVGDKAIYFTIGFLLFSAPVIYFSNSLIAKQRITIQWPELIVYLGLTMFLGSVFEIIVNSTFEYFIDRPSWIYHIWPKYEGYTSGVTCVMWPLYGFHLYCFHEAMKKIGSPLIQNTLVRGIMMAIDAMILEMIANLFAFITVGSYYFYYLHGDLNHFTTIEIFLPYVAVGIFVMFIISVVNQPKMPRITIGVVGLILGWIILYNG